MIHKQIEEIGEQIEDTFGQEVEQPNEAVSNNITYELHLLTQFTNAFQFVQVQDPYLSSIDGDHTLLGKG